VPQCQANVTSGDSAYDQPKKNTNELGKVAKLALWYVKMYRD
jgi:hypothetical protein